MLYSTSDAGQDEVGNSAGNPAASLSRSHSHPVVRVEWFDPSSRTQIEDILHIERVTNVMPDALREFRWLLRNGYLLRVARVRELVVGYLLYKGCQDGRQIVSVAVDPVIQRHGIGTLMINCLKRRMAEVPRLTKIVAQVPESHLAAQQFLRANQFQWAETIRRDSKEDVYVMKHLKPACDSKSTDVLASVVIPDSGSLSV